MDSTSELDLSDSADETYLPAQDEIDREDDSSHSETSDIENMPLNVRDDLAEHPDNSWLSKDKTIQFSPTPIDVNVRLSYAQNQSNITSGKYYKM